MTALMRFIGYGIVLVLFLATMVVLASPLFQLFGVPM